jgi:hypothetical protein
MKHLFLSTALIVLAVPAVAEPRNDTPVQVTNQSANAHVGIVQSESSSSATGGAGGAGGSATAHGGAGGNATGGTAVNGGNSNSINIEGDEAAASSAYAGSQFAATLCSGGAAFGIGAQTVGAGISLSFRGADRFCQIREVAGDRAAIGYLASKDRHARKAFEMAGILVPETKPTVSSKSRSTPVAGPLYAKCELDGRTLRFAPKAGVDRDAALAECKRTARVR